LIALQAYYVSEIEDKPILSAEYHLPLLAKTDPTCSAVSLR